MTKSVDAFNAQGSAECFVLRAGRTRATLFGFVLRTIELAFERASRTGTNSRGRQASQYSEICNSRHEGGHLVFFLHLYERVFIINI